MIYPESFESKIGFTVVREWLKAKCRSTLGQVQCERMRFSSDFNLVRRLLSQTAEMLSLIERGKSLPLDGIHDLTGQLREIHTAGSVLSPTEFYRLRSTLDTIGEISRFFQEEDEDGHLAVPALRELFASLQTFPSIISDIDGVINRFGEVRDDASPELQTLRRSIQLSQASLSSVMQKVVARAVEAGVVESGVTPSMRDGRLVIPVPASHKRQISGIVHDESATGKTTYIEPAEVVEASNRLRELREQEKREIHRILLALTDAIRPYADDMLKSYSKLGIYDFIYAKAELAKEFDASMPALERKTEIDWFGAVHPVLAHTLKQKGERVVPLNLHLDSTDRILIISGPNAGGKSVCLKTAGIVQYMLQCGMLPTLYSNSHVCLFDSLMIDIGDEQSIENDLSTYSSHLRNMKVFLNNAMPRTFILVDEMGSGTEPQIGGALAQSILARLNRNSVMGIVTTHYQNLKTFADREPGLVNGAMLYDREQMKPLFQLSIGNPGSSFALEIARKTGLPDDVIAEAGEIVGSDYVNMDKYLMDLARDKRYWEKKRRSIKEKEARLDQAIGRYDAKVEDLKEKRREIIAEAREQARELLSDSNARLERTIMEIKNAQAEKERTKQVRKELDDYKSKLAADDFADRKSSLGSKHEIMRKPRKKPEAVLSVPKMTSAVDKTIRPGDYVRMSKDGMIGSVLNVKGKEAEVAFGALRTRVDISKLIKSIPPRQTAATQTMSVSKSTLDDSRRRQLDFKQEIDIRGMRADEALQAVMYFIDDAVQFSARRVRILHGTGTGALRQAVREYLQANREVSSFHDEDVRFGGAGITVVNL
ncbi:MAG: Smr/MutS family protein [Muribaculaceae bacterium]|nr:Smr/MutS family protein [Muribaculaceae bacterium]